MWAQYWENIMYQHPAYLKSQHSKIWNFYEMEIELQTEFHDKKVIPYVFCVSILGYPISWLLTIG